MEPLPPRPRPHLPSRTDGNPCPPRARGSRPTRRTPHRTPPQKALRPAGRRAERSRPETIRAASAPLPTSASPRAAPAPKQGEPAQAARRGTPADAATRRATAAPSLPQRTGSRRRASSRSSRRGRRTTRPSRPPRPPLPPQARRTPSLRATRPFTPSGPRRSRTAALPTRPPTQPQPIDLRPLGRVPPGKTPRRIRSQRILRRPPEAGTTGQPLQPTAGAQRPATEPEGRTWGPENPAQAARQTEAPKGGGRSPETRPLPAIGRTHRGPTVRPPPLQRPGPRQPPHVEESAKPTGPPTRDGTPRAALA